MSSSTTWTPNDVIQNACNWSLDSDIRLLDCLKSLSQDLLSKAEQTNDNLNKLMENVSEASLSLDTVKKEFLSLHNTQFIESRVYEDDGTEPNAEQIVEDEVPKVLDWKETIQEGIRVMHNYYDKVEVPASDSEDETDFASYILRPKDVYADRRLPHLIGSDEWYKKWHVGLRDTSSESEEEKELEKLDESDDDLNINRIKLDTDSESVSDISNIKQPAANSTLEDVNNSELFHSNDSEDNNNSVPVQAPVSNNSFAQELARKLGNIMDQNPNVLDAEVNRKPIQTGKMSTRVIGNLFDDEPPPLDDDLFSSKVQEGLFSGGTGLFDDVAQDDSLNNPKNIPNNPRHKESKEKLPDLFSEPADDLFTSANTSIPKSEQTQVKKQNLSNLFDSDSADDDSDLFKDATSKPKKQSYLSSQNINKVPFIDSEPPELPSVKSKKPIGGVRLFGDSDILEGLKSASQRNVKVDTDRNIPSEPTNFHSGSINSQITKTDNTVDVERNTKPKQSPRQVKSVGLFDDINSEITTASNLTEKTEKLEAKKTQPPQLKSVSLFDDKDEQITKKPNTETKQPPPQLKPVSLFDDTDDIFGDGLFSSVSVKKFTSDLFSDDITNSSLFVPPSSTTFHEDLGFVSPKKTDSTTTAAKVVSVTETKPNKTQNQSVSINVDLFNENPPDLDDAWDSKSDNLFEDDENLFDSTSVVASYRSGLFDDEPPSLLSESSGIVKDMSCTRVETDDSFNPYASSSRRFSADIFKEQQSNDSFFVTKNIDYPQHSNLDSIPEIDSQSIVNVSANENSNNVFSESMFDDDQQDDLFSQNASSILPLSKSMFDNVNVSKIGVDDLFSSSKIDVSLQKGKTNLDSTVGVTKPKSASSSMFDDTFSTIKVQQEISSINVVETSASIKSNFDNMDVSKIGVDDLFSSSKTDVSLGKGKTDLDSTVGETKPKPASSSLFDNTFSTRNVEQEVSSVHVVETSQKSIFDNMDDVEDLFSSSKIDTSVRKGITDLDNTDGESKPKPATISIFSNTFSTKKTEQIPVVLPVHVVETSDIPSQIEDTSVRVQGSMETVTSKKSSPGKLKHNLNINVNALKPGMGIITKKDMNRTHSIEEDFAPDSTEKNNDTLETLEHGTESQILTNITKDRARIPVKRRPSTRKARQDAIRNSIADFRINIGQETHTQDDQNNEKPVNISEEKPVIDSKKQLTIDTTTEFAKTANAIENKSTDLHNTRPKSFTSSSLFDDPEDFDDLFTPVKLPPKSNILKQSLFGDENDDDDDLFGNSSYSSSKNLPSSSKSEPKKSLKTVQIIKPQNKAVVDDPLSLFKD